MIITDKELRYLPVDRAVEPEGGLVQVYRRYWWIVRPLHGLVFFKTRPQATAVPQCNTEESIVRHLIETVYDPSLRLIVMHMPRIYVPVRLARIGDNEMVVDLRKGTV